MNCGPLCLNTITVYYGKSVLLQEIETLCQLTPDGVSMFNLEKAAQTIGFKTLVAKIDFETLIEKVPLPLIAFWNNIHYIVVWSITKESINITDPTFGEQVISKEVFCKSWLNTISNNKPAGIVLLLEDINQQNE